MRLLKTMLGAMLLLPVSLPAPAQQSQLWFCEEGIRDVTGRMPSVIWNYQMVLWENGSFQDQGYTQGTGGTHNIQAEGQWQASGGGFRKVGQRYDGLTGLVKPYELNLTISMQGQMHDTTTSGNSIFAAQCRLQQ